MLETIKRIQIFPHLQLFGPKNNPTKSSPFTQPHSHLMTQLNIPLLCSANARFTDCDNRMDLQRGINSISGSDKWVIYCIPLGAIYGTGTKCTRQK